VAGACFEIGAGNRAAGRDVSIFGTRCSNRHVLLPERIAVGDDLVLKYRSNTKQHAFRVGQIRRAQDGGCTILRDSSQQSEDGDAIDRG